MCAFSFVNVFTSKPFVVTKYTEDAQRKYLIKVGDVIQFIDVLF